MTASANDDGQIQAGLSRDEFLDSADGYHAAGWLPLPIGRAVEGKPIGKVPWLRGLTGYHGKDADPDEFDTWPDQIARRIAKHGGVLNLGVRMPEGVLGIDVDTYDEKRGLATLAEREAQWGPLPPTYRITARTYDTGSGIRFYRVAGDYRGPASLKADDGSDGHIELIDRFHRFAAVPPSIHHTGMPYRLYGPDGCAVSPGTLPPPRRLPLLPETWQRGLADLASTYTAAACITDEAVAAFMEALEHNRRDHPKALDGPVNRIRNAKAGTRNLVRDLLRVVAGEVRLGFYPAHEAHDKIKQAATDSYAARNKSFDEHDFGRLWVNAVQLATERDLEEIAAEARRGYGTDSRAATGILTNFKVRILGGAESEVDVSAARTRFLGTSAAELAAPIPAMRWLVRDIWPQRSAGVLAGEKKTFKTWNLQAMALAVSAGVPMFDHFEVPAAGPVLYLCGEGGRDAFANRHQIIAARYGISNTDLADLPFRAEFETDELDNQELTDGITRHLDELQPVLVILDPLYAYHPHDVEASNLYAHGPMLAKLRELIEPWAALAVGDHFKKNTSSAFDLDNISMAGVGQWADTWILQRHRVTPDATKHLYQLEVESCTRRGGGRRWEIDWRLSRDPDPDNVGWSACDWAVHTSAGGSTTTPQHDRERRILDAVAAEPWKHTRASLYSLLGGSKRMFYETVKQLLATRELAERDPARGGRSKVLGPS